MATLLAAVSELAQDSKGAKPHVVALSSTGLGHGRPRDAPWLVLPLYHWLGAVPHADKRNMEDVLRKSTAVSAATIIRPSLLVDGDGTGLSGVRAGTETSPEVGYTIARKDVGTWIYHNLLTGQDTRWRGESISLTY